MESDQKQSSEPPCCRHIASFRAIKANQRRVFIEKLKELLAKKKTTDEKSSSSSDSSTSSSTDRGTLLGLGKRKRAEGGAQGGPLKKLKSVQEKVDGWLNKLKQNLEDEKQETGFTHDDSEILSLITQIQQTMPGKARRKLLGQLVKGLIEHDSVADKQLTALEEKAALRLQEQRQLPDAKTFQIHESSLVLMLRHIPFDTHPDHFNQVISELKKTKSLKVMDFSYSVFSESQFPELWEQIVRQSELQRLSLHDVKLSESNLALIDPKKWEKPPLLDLVSAHEEKELEEKKDVRPTALLRTALPRPEPLLTATPTVKPLRVLSMDGGGVKGLIERAILVVMLQEAKKINEKATIQSLFDIIIGTSTGGLITGGLAKFLDLDNIQDIFYWVATNIFSKKDNPVLRYPMMLLGKGWYDTGKLETLIKDKLDGENWWLGPAKAGDTGSKVVIPMGVCTTPWKWNTFATPVSVFWENFDTVTSNRSRTQVNLLQALRSTSAAPSYFDLKEINGDDYTDGGLGANNPIEQFCLQYIQTSKSPIITSDRLLHIVSLGCGHAKSEDEETSWWKFIDNWVNSLSQTEKTHKAMIKTCLAKNWEYLRLNLPPTQTQTPAGKTDLVYWGDLDLATSDITVLADMEEAATAYAVSQTESIKLHVARLLESAPLFNP